MYVPYELCLWQSVSDPQYLQLFVAWLDAVHPEFYSEECVEGFYATQVCVD